MRSMKLWVLLGLILIAVAFAGTSFADDNRYIRLRYVDGEVTLHPGDGQRPSEAAINMPVMDGDEVETGNGRTELAFRNGIVVRIGDYSNVRIESAYSPMTIELVGGTLFVDSRVVDRFGDELEVRAGQASVYVINEGNMRVDLGTQGSVRVTSIAGEAEVRASGQRVLLRAGQRTYVDPGAAPEQASAFDQKYDELDDWNDSRFNNYARNDYDQDRYQNEDVYYDSYDLDTYGDWRSYGDYGNVWVPQVSLGWRPYNDGRWIYGAGGWFWVSYEPWGWGPYHYGSWGYGLDIGWYWTPGYVFAPSWVYWYDYGDYIGWSPCGYGYGYDHGYYGGHGYGYPYVQKEKTDNIGNINNDSWTFVKKTDLGAANINKVIANSSTVKAIPIVASKVIQQPKTDYVNYVLPKTQVSPGFVNDKRIAPTPKDISNPVGLNHRSETKTVYGGRAVPAQDWEKQRAPKTYGTPGKIPSSTSTTSTTKTYGTPGTKPTPKTTPTPQPKTNPPVIQKEPKPVETKTVQPKPKASYDRDEQFERNSTNVKPFHSNESLYHDGNQGSGEKYGRDEDPSWFKSDRSYEPDDEYDNDRDVSPRYIDEARKMFERFEPETEYQDNDVERKDYSHDSDDNSHGRYDAPKHDYSHTDTNKYNSGSSNSSGSSKYNSGSKSSGGSSKYSSGSKSSGGSSKSYSSPKSTSHSSSSNKPKPKN